MWGENVKERYLDEQEHAIVRELIKNPRISDNQISKNTSVPVMTVNRKRKTLERESLLRYYCSFNAEESGSGVFKAKQLYMLKFRIGITKKEYLEALEYDKKHIVFNASCISLSYLGEKSGRLMLMLILVARSDSELVEEFNGRFIPMVKARLGEDAIEDVIVAKITQTLRRHHNYLPHVNMKDGKIKDDWPDSYIFVDRVKGKM
ncbi:winged helix-turn-helix transcriptional regulator [Candidatus Woesearchaeota archaeon]|nr:winged helix-turn-helix transcriptional regulator [Candidatus Woesearchaeota archaeon]